MDAAAEALLQPLMRKMFADEGSEHFRRRHAHRRGALLAILETAAARPDATTVTTAISSALAAQPELTVPEARECVHVLLDGFYLRLDVHDRLVWVNPLFRGWWLRFGGA